MTDTGNSRDARWGQDGVKTLPLPQGMAQITARGGTMLAGPTPGDDVELYTDDGGKGKWVAGFKALSGIKQGELGGPYDGMDVVWVGKPEAHAIMSMGAEGDEWPAEYVRLAKGDKTPFGDTPAGADKPQDGLGNKTQDAPAHFAIRSEGTSVVTRMTFYDPTEIRTVAEFFDPLQQRGFHGRWVDEGRQAYRQWAETGGSSRPEIKKPIPYGTDKQIAGDVAALAKQGITVDSIANRLIKVIGMASPEEAAKWGDWYITREAEMEAWGKRWNVPAYVPTAAIAATSPQTLWDDKHFPPVPNSNQAIAERALHIALDPAFTEKEVTITQEMADEFERVQEAKKVEAAAKRIAKGQKPRDTKVISWTKYNGADFHYREGINLVGTHKLGDLPADVAVALNADYVSAMQENVTKAVMVARGADPALILGGAGKTRSFYNNIIRPTTSTDATVDVHMMRGLLDRLDLSDSELTGFAGDAEKYKVFSDGVKEGARRMGMIPSRAQAIFWEEWRKQHEASERAALTKSGKTANKAYIPN